MTPDPRDTDPLTVADDPTEPPPLRWGCFFMALGAWLAWATFVGVVWAVTR